MTGRVDALYLPCVVAERRRRDFDVQCPGPSTTSNDMSAVPAQIHDVSRTIRSRAQSGGHDHRGPYRSRVQPIAPEPGFTMMRERDTEASPDHIRFSRGRSDASRKLTSNPQAAVHHRYAPRAAGNCRRRHGQLHDSCLANTLNGDRVVGHDILYQPKCDGPPLYDECLPPQAFCYGAVYKYAFDPVQFRTDYHEVSLRCRTRF